MKVKIWPYEDREKYVALVEAEFGGPAHFADNVLAVDLARRLD